MKKICVYTCITGDYDNLKELKKVEDNIDYYCFTNNHNIKSRTWTIIHIDNDGLDNQRLSRKIKIIGHSILNDYDVCVWQDASVVFNKSIIEFINNYYNDEKDIICIPRHYCRKSVKEEAKECIRLKKDNKEVINELLYFYKKEKFKDDLGLFENTVFIRNNKSEILKKTAEIWFQTLKKYSKRDQLSLTYAAFKTGLKITPINIVVWDNEWFDALPHNTYGKTYNVYYSSKNNDIYDKMDVYYYKVVDNNLIIEFKNKKNKFKICIADTKNILCTIIKSNCKFSNDGMINYDNTYFSSDNFVFLRGKKKVNSSIKIIVNLEKVTDNIHEILVKMNGELQKKNNDIYNLTNQNNDLNNQIRKIENSSSWKITKPLRSIKKIIRK